ncbi:hypothetical protein FRC07_014030, partial [Ceratobasidium sp. 392]
RARRFGFASVPHNQLSEDLSGMKTSLEFEAFHVMKYTARNKPAGARIKTSLLPATATSGSNRASRTNNNTAVVVNEEDAAWANDLVNNTLAGWIWAKMREADRTSTPNRSTFRGPLLLSRWATCVDQGVRYKARDSNTGFDKVAQRLMPASWVLLEKANIWMTLQHVFLNEVQERLSTVNESQRHQYSLRLREVLVDVLKT